MRKEIIFAIAAGVIFGVIIAFGFWRLNSSFKESQSQTTNKNLDTKSPDELSLAIISPENLDIIIESPFIITGLTKSNTWVSISSEEEDFVFKSEENGEFNQEIDLIGGANQLLISVFDENGNSIDESIIVVYSTEFKI